MIFAGAAASLADGDSPAGFVVQQPSVSESTAAGPEQPYLLTRNTNQHRWGAHT